MERPMSRALHPVCIACRLARRLGPGTYSRQTGVLSSLSIPQASLLTPSSNVQVTHRRTGQIIRTARCFATAASQSTRPSHSIEVETEIQDAKSLVKTTLADAGIPTEEAVLNSLYAVGNAAQLLLDFSGLDRPKPQREENSASSILRLDPRQRAQKPTTPEPVSVRKSIDQLSNLAYSLVKHPAVFLTPEILSRYVSIQAQLHRPSSFPEIFHLYATKPAPAMSKGSSEIKYSPESPNAVASAVDENVASIALDSALQARDLTLAFNVIETSFRTPAYRKNKIFRRAAPPLAIAGLTPVAAYALASTLATQQTGLSPEDFTNIAFAGMLTYVGAVGTIGYVALTTSNDQMQRVTWAVGMPLWERWLREDERRAADHVALAWGFSQKTRWGDEEGSEWETIREWCGLRGMTLDKVGLMEGME